MILDFLFKKPPVEREYHPSDRNESLPPMTYNPCCEIPLDTPKVIISKPGVIPVDDSEIFGLSGRNFPIGVIRSTDNYNSYHLSNLRTTWENLNMIQPRYFELIVNVNRMWGYQLGKSYINPIPSQGYGISYRTCNPGRIVIKDDSLIGLNETDIQACIVRFSITKASNGYKAELLNDVSLSRRTYSSVYADHLGDGLSNDMSSFNIKIDPIIYSMSDLNGISNFFESITPIIKENVENNFKEEIIKYKKILVRDEILSNYRKSINEEVIRDIFTHVIDILGTPAIEFNKLSHQYVISFKSQDSKISGYSEISNMSDFLYELGDATNRIKSCYSNLNFGISMGSMILISISPNIEFDERTKFTNLLQRLNTSDFILLDNN